MASTNLVSRLCRSGGAPGLALMAVARAGVFSGVNTVLAVSGHHVVFDVSPSWGARGVAPVLFFALAVTGSGAPSTPARQVALALTGQVTAGCWFALGVAEGYGRLSEAWPLVSIHAVMTVLMALMLHIAQDGRLGAFRATTAELCAVCDQLLRLLCPRFRADAPDPLMPRALSHSGHARASPGRRPFADCVVRRGPPLGAVLVAA